MNNRKFINVAFSNLVKDVENHDKELKKVSKEISNHKQEMRIKSKKFDLIRNK